MDVLWLEVFGLSTWYHSSSAQNTHSPEKPPPSELIRQCDVKGILHSHSRYCDGAHSLGAMVFTAREIGLEYLGISDHYRSDVHRNGLNSAKILRQREEINSLKNEFPGFEILQGVELAAAPDGSLPLDDDILSLFDYVIVSFFDGDGAAPADQTERILSVLRNPSTTIIGKPLGDYMLRRPPVPADMELILCEAAKAGVPVEIDANPHAPDLDWGYCHRAQELGVMLCINPNAHRAARLVDYRHGVELVRNAGICCHSILNTMNCETLKRYITRRR
jgi:DNA polymerase (family 10)